MSGPAVTAGEPVTDLRYSLTFYGSKAAKAFAAFEAAAKMDSKVASAWHFVEGAWSEGEESKVVFRHKNEADVEVW